MADCCQYVTVELNDDLIIMYSKQGDKLPLTTFSMSAGSPCMDSDSVVSSNFYPIELNRASNCPLEQTTGETYDPRYTLANAQDDVFKFGEWDIMQENNVALILTSLPSYIYALGT